MSTQHGVAALTPKEVTAQTELSIYTLRYYERLGLIDPVERAASGHRVYRPQDVKRIQFLKRMRRTGMSITMLQHYLDLLRQGKGTLAERRAMLEAHRHDVAAQMQELQQTLDFIDYKLDLFAVELDCAGDST